MMFLLEMQKGSLVCRACYFFKGKKTGEGRGKPFFRKGFPSLSNYYRSKITLQATAT